MSNNSTGVQIYIDLSKPYYYPGDNILASIYLDALESVKCNKMVVTAKGKQIIKATQNYKFQDEEEEKNVESDDDDEDENIQKDFTEINKTKEIFKFSKIIQISNNNCVSRGKYSFPFEVELPENLPGSFLFLEGKIYAEIIYSISVKLVNIDIKEKMPIIIRQKKEIFNYPLSNEYNKKLGGCC